VNPSLCLLPSPLTGPSPWQEVAAHLPGRVITIPWRGSPPQDSEQVLAWFLDAIPADEDVVLIPHSNAGLYVPAITQRRRVRGFVFVDAGLPPHAGDYPLAPPVFRDFLAGKADSAGMLPRWTDWWDADISGLFPSTDIRERTERDMPRLPLAYFGQTLHAPEGWDQRPGAYLAFGDTYAEERADAGNRGWPVRTIRGEHLHMLVSPVEVAAAITSLVP
jgi:hypothetical protein